MVGWTSTAMGGQVWTGCSERLLPTTQSRKDKVCKNRTMAIGGQWLRVASPNMCRDEEGQLKSMNDNQDHNVDREENDHLYEDNGRPQWHSLGDNDLDDENGDDQHDGKPRKEEHGDEDQGQKEMENMTTTPRTTTSNPCVVMAMLNRNKKTNYRTTTNSPWATMVMVTHE